MSTALLFWLPLLGLLVVAVAFLILRPPIGERDHPYRRRRDVPVAVDRRKK